MSSDGEKREVDEPTEAAEDGVREAAATASVISIDCLLHVFRFLGAADLATCSRVCRQWYGVATHPSLWKMVSFKQTKVKKWQTIIDWLKKYQPLALDLHDVILSGEGDWSQQWLEFVQAVPQLTQLGLSTLRFGHLPPATLHQLADSLSKMAAPGLQTLVADFLSQHNYEPLVWTTNTTLDVGKLAQLVGLKELRVRGACGIRTPTFAFSGGLQAFQSLVHLKKLSLTTLRNVPSHEFRFLQHLSQLEELEIGDCFDWTSQTYQVLGRLTRLTSLRLECGGSVVDTGITAALAKMTRLQSLSLIMFNVPEELGPVLRSLPRLTTLAVWPDTGSEKDAVVNSATLGLVELLVNLCQLQWGVLTESGSGTQTASPATNNATIVLLPSSQQEGALPIEGATSPTRAPFIPPGEGEEQVLVASVAELKKHLIQLLPSTNIDILAIPILSAPKPYYALWSP